MRHQLIGLLRLVIHPFWHAPPTGRGTGRHDHAFSTPITRRLPLLLVLGHVGGRKESTTMEARVP
jgi:hypothetical protein